MRQHRHERVWLGTAYAGVGCSALIALSHYQDLPPILPFVSFLALAGYIEWRAVEIGPRLRASAAVMVYMAVGVAFRDTGAAMAMALLAVAGTIGPVDVRDRRVFVPAVNFGQLVVSAIAAGTVLDLLLTDPIPVERVWLIPLITAIAGVTQMIVNFAQVAAILRTQQQGGAQGLVSGLNQVFPAYAILSVVGGLLGATYLIVGPEVTPFIVVMVLMGHFAATSYAGVREAREATMKGFIKALEARDLYARGHTERVMMFASMIGSEMGLPDDVIEQIRWAALLSDVSTLAVPRDLLEHRDSLTDEEKGQVEAYMSAVDDMLERVDFLRPAMRIAREREFSAPPRVGHAAVASAQVLGVAKQFDRLTAGGSRTRARSQGEAFDALRMARDRFYDHRVVDALESAIRRSGHTYGAVELTDLPTLDDIAKKRMYERG